MKSKQATVCGVTCSGDSVKTAKSNAEGRITQHLSALQTPRIYRWTGITGILWSELSDRGESVWYYHLVYDQETPSRSDGVCRVQANIYGSKEQSERSMRIHAAQRYYDQTGEEDHGIVLDENDRHTHQRWIHWQRRYSELKSAGLSQEVIDAQLRAENL